MSPFRSGRSLSTSARTLVSIGLVVAALSGSLALFGALAAMKQPAAVRDIGERTYNVEVFSVEDHELLELISAFGTARADREVVVSAEVSGTIVDVHPELKVGLSVQGPGIRAPEYGHPDPDVGLGLSHYAGVIDTLLGSIRHGDLLARIDSRSYLERVRQARNRLVEDGVAVQQVLQEERNNARLLARARSDYDDYRREYQKLRDLRRRNSATESQLTSAEIQLRAYETGVLKLEDQQTLLPIRRQQLLEQRETHRAELELAELELLRTEVRPPFSGQLSEVFVEEGQYVRTGDPLVRLTDVSRVEIPLPVRLEDYARIEPRGRSGERVPVEFSESTTAATRWRGTVVRVSPEVDELTRTVMVYAVVDNQAAENQQQSPLLAGTFVHARIHGPVLSRIHVVPRDTIINGTVFAIAEPSAADKDEPMRLRGRVVRKPVEIRQTFGSLAWVSSSDDTEPPLQPGEPLVFTNLDVIDEQSLVEWNAATRRTLVDELRDQQVELLRLAPPQSARSSRD